MTGSELLSVLQGLPPDQLSQDVCVWTAGQLAQVQTIKPRKAWERGNSAACLEASPYAAPVEPSPATPAEKGPPKK